MNKIIIDEMRGIEEDLPFIEKGNTIQYTDDKDAMKIDTEVCDAINKFMEKYAIAPNLIMLNVDTTQELIDILNRYSEHKINSISKFRGINVKTIGMGERVKVVLE